MTSPALTNWHQGGDLPLSSSPSPPTPSPGPQEQSWGCQHPRGRPEPCVSCAPRAGCGNSALSHDLYQLGYTDVTSIDFSPACIAAMRARYAHCPGLRWAVMDIRALAFPDASFDVVLEKGTLDVLMVEETDPWHVSPQAAAAMRRVLAEVRAGGTPSPFGVGEGCRVPPHHLAFLWVPQPVLLSSQPVLPIRGAPGGPPALLGVGDCPLLLPIISSPGRWVEQDASLRPAGGLDDPSLYLHAKYKELAGETGPILAWVAVGDLGGHTEVALPAQGKVMTVGL